MPDSPTSTPPPETMPSASTGRNSDCRSASPANSRSSRSATPQSQTQHSSHQQHQSQIQQQNHEESCRSGSPITVSNNSNNSNNNCDKTASNTNNTQQFCLRWNNYQTNLTSVFDQLLQNESFVDVTLACDDNSIKAHKMVLSACSPYFQSLFFDNPCQHPIIIMRDVKWPELKAAVEFMYKGEINISQEQIGPLLRLAETLKIRGLADVKKDSELNTLPQESLTTAPAMPDVPPYKKERRSEWDMSNMDLLPQHLSSSSSTRQHQRKRRWPSTENRSNFGSPMETTPTPEQNETVTNAATTGSPHPASTSAATAGASTSTTASPIPQNTSSSVSRPSSSPIPSFPIPSQAALDAMALSSLGMVHSEEMEIKPGIAEMIREEERVGRHYFSLVVMSEQTILSHSSR